MPAKRRMNAVRVQGDVASIVLRRKDGTTMLAIIDMEDVQIAQSTGRAWYAWWSPIAKTFYVRDRNGVMLHRLIMRCPKELDIDHRDHCGLHNQKHNLFVSSRSKNRLNQAHVQDATRSGLRGVTRHNGKWRARIMVNGQEKSLGRFRYKEDASEVVENFLLVHLGKQRFHEENS